MPSDTLMYPNSDPRAKLSTAKAGGVTSAERGFGASSYALFGETRPQIEDAAGRTWFIRGQNFVVAYTEANPGARFERHDQIDEYVALVDFPATADAQGDSVALRGDQIVMMPPGDSSLELPQGGTLVRLFTTRSADLAAMASNGDVYKEPAPFIPPLEPWPDPVGGFRIRPYDLSVAPQEGRFGRIWRCTTFMINVFEPAGPRDPEKLSPHHHDDFEQGSLALGGSFLHHLRWPWTANSKHWRDDEHKLCPAPSVVIIPPRSIHTSAPVAEEDNRLVDIFSPPRWDFSAMEGWVLNAADYPMPPRVQGEP